MPWPAGRALITLVDAYMQYITEVIFGGLGQNLEKKKTFQGGVQEATNIYQ